MEYLCSSFPSRQTESELTLYVNPWLYLWPDRLYSSSSRRSKSVSPPSVFHSQHGAVHSWEKHIHLEIVFTSLEVHHPKRSISVAHAGGEGLEMRWDELSWR